MIEKQYPHFESIGLSSDLEFDEVPTEIEGFEVIQLHTRGRVQGLEDSNPRQAYRVVNRHRPARIWRTLDEGLVFTPWFSRGNRGGNGHIRTSLLRSD
jgi:hypothetical protein